LPVKGGRAYEHSHPWISFTVDLRPAAPRVWSLLGQAVAGCRQVAGAALPPPQAAEMYRLYLSRGARATTAIEGNTLSEAQVRARLDGQLDLPLSQEYLGREVGNILEACERIRQQIHGGDAPRLSPDLVADYNRRVLAGLEEHLDEGVVAGEIPRHRVAVAGYQGAPRSDCLHLLARMCEWLEQEPAGSPFPHAPDNRIAVGLLQAILAHLYLAWIHPFGDGNGRTARLVEFMLLARSGVPAPTAHLLSNHYNQTRAEYYRQLDRSSRANAGRGDPLEFLCYALQGFMDGVREQCAYVGRVQLAIAWEHLVYETFHAEPSTGANARRRMLVLALGAAEHPVPKSAIVDLTPALTRAYAVKTAKTLTRDLNWLLDRDLVLRGAHGYRARVERMHSFQPATAVP
jgi:Fic family protein